MFTVFTLMRVIPEVSYRRCIFLKFASEMLKTLKKYFI